MKQQTDNGWSGFKGRVVVWALGVVMLGVTALVNYRTLQAQVAFREEVDKRYVTKAQWQERWDGHTRQEEQMRHATATLEVSIRAFNENSAKIGERMARMEALLEQLQRERNNE